MDVGTAIETCRLTKRYGQSRGIEDLDLEVFAGEVFGLIGPNGAGKTTTIRLLLDLIRPTSGSARVFGRDVRHSNVEIHTHTGYLPSDIRLYEGLTADEFFDWLGRLRGRHDASFTDELIERFALDPHRPIGELSTGNQQKVGLIQAFSHRPSLLILDEPTSGLDPVVRREFRSVVHETTALGATVFVSSHELSEVQDVCDRVGTVLEGRLESVRAIADLAELHHRSVRLVLDEVVQAEEIAGLDGVGAVQVVPSVVGQTIFELQVTGSFEHLVRRLARFRVLDVISQPASLEDVFLQSFDRTGREIQKVGQ